MCPSHRLHFFAFPNHLVALPLNLAQVGTPCSYFLSSTTSSSKTIVVISVSLRHHLLHVQEKDEKLNYILLCQIKCICGESYGTTLFKTNLQLKHIEFLSRLMVTMLCRIRHAETGFDASKSVENRGPCVKPNIHGSKLLFWFANRVFLRCF